MLAPRWRKVLADLWSSKLRSVLAILSIAAGVQIVGTITTSYTIITRDMDASFMAIHPAGGTMTTSAFDASFVEALQQAPGVDALEPRARLSGLQLLGGDTPIVLTLTGIAAFDQIQLDQLLLDDGNWPATGSLVLERRSLGDTAVSIGDIVRLETPTGSQSQLKVAGFVEDRTTNAANAGLLGYVTLDTLEALGLPRSFNTLGFTVAENTTDREHVAAVGRTIEAAFERAGGVVQSTVIRDPGRHPSAQQATAVIGLLVVLAGLTLFLSAFLVTNTVSALMAQQIRHIGVMKAVGARTGQIVGMYVVLLLCLGLPALLLAAPLGLWAGYEATRVVATFLNFSIGTFRLEPLPVVVMVILSLGVPVLAGLVPVRNGAVTTVREAIAGYGLNAPFGQDLIARFFSRLSGATLFGGLPRPLLISLRNTARRKVRLALTLATLILAGAIFIGVVSVDASMDAGLTQMYQYYLGDVNVNFDRTYPVREMVTRMQQVPGVARVEGWIFATGEVHNAAGDVTDSLTVTAPPADSAIVARSVEEGRWLLPDDTNAIVMCTRAMGLHPEWQIGSTIRLTLDNRAASDFVIVGTFPFASGEGNLMAIASQDYVVGLLDQEGEASTFRLLTAPRDAATQDSVRDTLAATFKEGGFAAEVTSGHTTADALDGVLERIVLFLMLMALLVAMVGALGLTGAMTINVLERTREIGVMRAIGASNRTVMQLVLVEGLLTGLLSWVAGALLGVPVGAVMARILGQGLFDTPFALVPAWDSVFIWLLVVAVLSIVASGLPAWNASRLTVREALAYE